MISVDAPFVLTAVLLAGATGLFIQLCRCGSNGKLPPGPKPKFLIGNALDIPMASASRVYYAWTKQYNSNIIFLNAFGTRLYILHSREDADELLENRAKLYSDRAHLPLIDTIGWGYNFALYPYGDRWRAHRRVAHQNFKVQTAPVFYPIQAKKVNDMLIGLLDVPERFDDLIKMLSISIPLASMFGYDLKSLDDPVIHAADLHMSIGEMVAGPGGSLANIFPLFKHVPWTWTQRMSKECRKWSIELKRIPFETLIRSMANGKAEPSFVGNFLERKQTARATPDEEEIVLNVAHTVYGAASDTTISATRSFMYLMAVHPAIQAKAQAELDRVLGETPRLPTFDDRPALPYLEAIYREVLRWSPPVPMGVGHASIQDDWYKGFFIPKGSIIIPNIWAMGLDEKHFGPDAHTFNPDRFFDRDGQLNDKDRILAYGFGKRACVGKPVASATLWLTMASILACFSLDKKRDEHGNYKEINDEFQEGGFILHKAPHECDITPRSGAWREMIETLRDC